MSRSDGAGSRPYATLGPDPMSLKLGDMLFATAPSGSDAPDGPTVDTRSSYRSAGNPALDSMGRIIAGKGTEVTPSTFTP